MRLTVTIVRSFACAFGALLIFVGLLGMVVPTVFLSLSEGYETFVTNNTKASQQLLTMGVSFGLGALSVLGGGLLILSTTNQVFNRREKERHVQLSFKAVGTQEHAA